MTIDHILIILIIFVSVCIIYSASISTDCENFSNAPYKKLHMDRLKYYFLTMPTSDQRKKHMKEIFKNYDLTEVNPIIGIPRHQSGASGFMRMIDLGLREQNNDLPFQPFVIMEDDCSFYRPIPQTIDVPSNADLLYIGLSTFGMNDRYAAVNNAIYADDVDQNLIRVKNMLAMHGIVVCSPLGASVIQKCMMDAYQKNEAWDMCLAYTQPYYNMYALKSPLVYQDKTFGGQQDATKISTPTQWIRPQPVHMINRSILAVQTVQTKKH